MNINDFLVTQDESNNINQQYQQQYPPQQQQYPQQNYPPQRQYPLQRPYPQRRRPPPPKRKKLPLNLILHGIILIIFLIVTLANRCTCTCDHEVVRLNTVAGIAPELPDESDYIEDEEEEDTYISLRDMYDRIVWLDAGHGGIDGGTSGILNGVTYLEKDIVLDIVLITYELFNNSTSGIKAMLSRSDDTFIHRTERTPLWNDSADLVVSVHIDFYEGVTAPYVYGIQVNFDEHFDETRNPSRAHVNAEQFAQIMQNHLVQATGARDRQIRGNRNFIVCRDSTMPALLIEAGFMSNQAELALLVTEEYQRQIANAIYNAVVEAFDF